MKISAKTRYAMAAVIYMGRRYETKECITLLTLAEQLSISKIYLEQVFSLLKRAGLVTAIKGAQGGYLLAHPPHEINVYDIMFAVETSLFVQNIETVEKSAPHIEKAMQNVFAALDQTVKEALSGMTLSALVQDAEKNSNNYMYYL